MNLWSFSKTSLDLQALKKIETSEMDSSAKARQRRKVKLTKRRREDVDIEDVEPEEVMADGERQKPHITGIKRQARYDPGVSMTREELTEWRKEARRVRNRESAAESRQRTRVRIESLEDQLATLESKYSAALKRIEELESMSSASNDTTSPVTIAQEQSFEEPVVSPCSSPHLASVVSPISSPRSSFSLNDDHHEKVEKKYKHIMELISRPTA